MKRVSSRALDALNFCNAGIQTGLGPFISIYYGAVRRWNPAQIGLLLACQSLAGVLTQTFVGRFMDGSRHKRLVTAIAALVVTAGALGIALLPSFSLQIGVQLVIGLGVTVFPAATSAFALGLVDRDDLPRRLARNEMFTHGGNATFAVIAGVVGTMVALGGIFFTAAAFAAGMAGAALFIRDGEVNYEAARADEKPAQDGRAPRRRGGRELFADRRVLVFAAAVILFNASNSATLPLVGQIFAGGQGGHRHGHGQSAGWQTAVAVLVAELVMIAGAAYTGRKAGSFGRKPLFVAAFGLLALRNALGVVSHAPGYLITLQALDGAAAAIYGVLLKLVTSDLAQGTGRFNFLQGAVQSAMGAGGFLSNLLFGFVARALGFNASFWGLSAVAVVGGLVYLLAMPETRSRTESGGGAQGGGTAPAAAQ
jgi:MFS family permease